MSRKHSLLEVLQAVIERTYRLDTGIREIERFVVGDRGLERLYGRSRIVSWIGSRDAGDAKVLVREDRGSGEIRVNIYYPDALIRGLEARNPLHGLDAENLDLFAVFVEELDHFLTLADRSRAGRPVSLLELELHANVTKYVASRHFLERSIGRPLAGGERGWLRWTLFEKNEAAPGPPEVRERYHMADRLGHRYAAHLDRLPPRLRLAELRAFHRRSRASALRGLEAIAA